MTRAPLLLLLALAGCVQLPVSLRTPDLPDLPYDSTGASLAVLPPVDLRPLEEIDGVAPGFIHALPPLSLPLPFLSVSGSSSALRGPVVTGSQDFGPEAWIELEESFRRAMASTRLFARVDGDPSSSGFVLETEVLHFLASVYEVEVGRSVTVAIGSSALGVRGQRQQEQSATTLPHATVVLRLRLRRAGQVVGERIVRSALLGAPLRQPTRRDLARFAREALHSVLVKARVQVATWVREATATGTRDEHLARHAGDHARGHTFLVHSVIPGRTGVRLAEVSCPSGAVLREWTTDTVPLVGRPGAWLLSPFDAQGVKLPAVEYDALSQHLSGGFVLRRVDEVAVYHYFGPRLTTVQAGYRKH